MPVQPGREGFAAEGSGSRAQLAIVVLVAALAFLLIAGIVGAAVLLVQLSSDPYTNPTSQHATEVEPDTFAFGSTIVAAFQAGRFFDGGASNIGFATSMDGGTTWTNGFLPGTTHLVGGPYDRVSDPSVAYDARHGVWIVSSLALNEPSVVGVAVIASRSTDGVNWMHPLTIAIGGNLDKNWTVCDNTPSSPFYGNCYTQWDDHADANRIKMSTSTDGGVTWGAAKNTADNATGLAGQPLVRPNGVVVVPIANANVTEIRYFRSPNGGASWSATRLVSSIVSHRVAGNIRSLPIPSAEIDGAGKVYVVWHDCRFRASCSSNDIVMAAIKGRTVLPLVRVPIDPVGSTVDHFIPGLAVDRKTSGSSSRLGLTYYYYPVSRCASTCQLHVGFASSDDGGATWSTTTDLAGPMHPKWLANTTQGRMVGDYISTSFVGTTAWTVFAVANAPIGSTFDEAMYAPVAGLFGQAVTRVGADQPLVAASPDPAPPDPLTAR